jgi:DNA-binding response OmpR family regulator
VVVDDDPAIRVLLRQILSREFEVDTADGATSALEQAGDRPYDIAILDSMLRDHLDGREVMRHLRGKQ